MDAWVHEDFRRKGIFTSLWDERWEYVKKHYKGYTSICLVFTYELRTFKKKRF